MQKYYWPGARGSWILVQGHFWGPWKNIDLSAKYSPLKLPNVLSKSYACQYSGSPSHPAARAWRAWPSTWSLTTSALLFSVTTSSSRRSVLDIQNLISFEKVQIRRRDFLNLPKYFLCPGRCRQEDWCHRRRPFQHWVSWQGRWCPWQPHWWQGSLWLQREVQSWRLPALSPGSPCSSHCRLVSRWISSTRYFWNN